MLNTITQWVNSLHAGSDKLSLMPPLQAIGDRLSCVGFQTAALRIKGGSLSAIVQTNAVWSGIAQGKMITVATAIDMPALVGSVTNAKFNLFAFFIDSAGVVTGQMGVEGATLAAVVFPPIPVGKTVLGYVTINPTGAGNFVGGTTTLDSAGVIPNANFVNTLGPFDPTILI